MNPKLDKFIKSKQICKSVLNKQKDEILKLRKLGYSLESICQYLETVNIKTTKQNLSGWLKRQIPKEPIIQNPTVINQMQNTNDSKLQTQKPQELTTTQSEEESVANLMKFASKRITYDDMLNHGKNT